MTKQPPYVGPIDKMNQETASRGVNQQNRTGRAHAGYSKVEIAYCASNPQSIDKKHKSI